MTIGALSLNTDSLADEPSSVSGKSRLLASLAPRVRSAAIPAFVVVPVERWRTERAAVLDLCRERFGNDPTAVRSDSFCEDSGRDSAAGAFVSLLDVEFRDRERAIDTVVRGLPGHAQDRVMVQAMVRGVVAAGVAATHRIDDGAPWYCVDIATSSSAAVTAGRACTSRVAIARDAARQSLENGRLAVPAQLALTLLMEVESLMDGEPIEIEFAIAPGGEVATAIPTTRDAAERAVRAHLLQARRITTASRWSAATASQSRLPSLGFLHASDPLPDVAGTRTVLSLMADWNPAELIGEHPRSLSLSLFERLIARGVWWHARASLGYSAAPSADVGLLRVLRGRPLVDVRRSSNSMLPLGLDIAARRQLVDCWIDRLCEAPALHDKVEFDVYRTARDFRASDALRREWTPLLGMSAWRRWEGALGTLTRTLMATEPDSAMGRCLAVTDALANEAIDARPWQALLDRCSNGTTAFATLARIAFVAEAQLRSAVERGALPPERALELRGSSRSFPLPSAADVRSDGAEALSHLRPGTFDITERNWTDTFPLVDAAATGVGRTFALRDAERHAIETLLTEADLPAGAHRWVHFVQASFRARERSKFVFSRHLSAALERIAGTCATDGLDRDGASWLTLDELAHGCGMIHSDRRRYWSDRSRAAREAHDAQSRLILSPVVRDETDRIIATSLETLPNFIGRHAVQGPVIPLSDPRSRAMDLQGGIVVVRQADPGYDWLFGRGIAGLITAWGGANSHLAIRCAEFGLSAAIGCGESVFTRAAQARHARLDPTAGGLWLN